jgi:dipeptidase
MRRHRTEAKGKLSIVTAATVVVAALLVPLTLALPALACTTVLVGRGASADGSVLIAHNEDDSYADCQVIKVFPQLTHPPGSVYDLYYGGTVPQPALTQAYIATSVCSKSLIPGDITGTLNEHQVAIFNNMAPGRSVAFWKNAILWSEFSQLAAQQASSAREAVQIIGSLVRDHGLGFDNGTLFGVADASEGWWVEISDHEWVARRVPDNAAETRANCFGIGVVDFNDPANFMWSPDVVQYALRKHYYDPVSDGPFNWSKAYAKAGSLHSTSNTDRLTMVPRLLTADMPGGITKQELMSIMRTHYEGSEYDYSSDYAVSPHSTKAYTVCNLDTVASQVCELRGWLPAEIGGVMWTALRTPCSSVYVPWYAGVTRVPAEYSTGTSRWTPGSAYWAFNDLVTWVDGSYKGRIGDVQAAWKGFEEDEFAAQSGIEATALRKYKTDPTSVGQYLTDYANAQAHQTYVQAQELTR